MKPIAILFAGCVPLAVLTAWSFVELGSVGEQPAPQTVSTDVEAETKLADVIRAQVGREKPLCDELAEVDLLSPEPIPALDAVPDDSSFTLLKDTWPQWTDARQTVTAYLEAERLAATTDLERLKDAGRRLEDLKAKCDASPLRGGEPLLTLLDQRIAALKQQVLRRQRQLDADALLEQARAAFRSQQYAPCATLCGELLSGYAQVLDPATAEKVRILKERAQFWDDAGRLVVLLREAGTPERRASVLESFLKRYPDSDSRTAAERGVLEKSQRELRDVKDQLAAEEQDRAAVRLLDALDGDLPARFEDRLETSVRIVREYPLHTAKVRLRTSVEAWLREFLPEKRIEELPALQEAETDRRQIIRGFFKEVKAPDGTLVGYKRYPTYAQYLNPVSEVGTYRKEELTAGPAESLPRRSVNQYNALRNRLLQAPDRRETWAEFAALCETLQIELNEYRKKSGSGNEDLSFEREGQFARELLAGPGWTDMETVLGP